jgi:hypothetical protein
MEVFFHNCSAGHSKQRTGKKLHRIIHLWVQVKSGQIESNINVLVFIFYCNISRVYYWGKVDKEHMGPLCTFLQPSMNLLQSVTQKVNKHYVLGHSCQDKKTKTLSEWNEWHIKKGVVWHFWRLSNPRLKCWLIQCMVRVCFQAHECDLPYLYTVYRVRELYRFSFVCLFHSVLLCCVQEFYLAHSPCFKFVLQQWGTPPLPGYSFIRILIQSWGLDSHNLFKV